jgi:hypothetical protein
MAKVQYLCRLITSSQTDVLSTVGSANIGFSVLHGSRFPVLLTHLGQMDAILDQSNRHLKPTSIWVWHNQHHLAISGFIVLFRAKSWLQIQTSNSD